MKNVKRVEWVTKFKQVVKPDDRVLVIALGYAGHHDYRDAIFAGVNDAGDPCCTWKQRYSTWYRPSVNSAGEKVRTLLPHWEPGAECFMSTRDKTTAFPAGRIFKLAD